MITVEFFGISRTGKTTLSKRLVNFLRSEGHVTEYYKRPNISFKDMGSFEMFHRVFFDTMKKTYEKALSINADFLIYDRGFFDRKAMLKLDCLQGLVGSHFRDELSFELENYLTKVNYPFLFIVDSEISLSRLTGQKEKGLDNSSLCEGMETRETRSGIEKSIKIYRELADGFSQILQVPCNGSEHESYTFIVSRLNRELNFDLCTLKNA